MSIYNPFISITNLDNSAYKSIFMYVDEAIEKIENIQLQELAIIFPGTNATDIIYKLTPGNTIPKQIFSIIYLLFNKSDLINEELELLLTFTYKNKAHKLSFTNGQYFISDDSLSPLFTDSKYFNFMDGVTISTINVENFEKIFGFLLKKDLPNYVEPNFELQVNKYLSNNLDTTSEITSSNIIHKEVLIEKLVKQRNDHFKKVADLTQTRLSLVTERDKVDMYFKNKDQNELKYQAMGEDYKKLIGQEKFFYKNVNDINSIISKIDQELASIIDYQNSLNLPEEERVSLEEKKEFFLTKKASLKGSLIEAEANLNSISEMVKTTKLQLDTLHSDLNIIDTIEAPKDSEDYETKINKINTTIEEIYLSISLLDTEINGLHKDIAQLSLSEDYKNTTSLVSNEVEKNSIINSLNKNIIPNSINVVYKYLCNLYLFYIQQHHNKPDKLKVTLESIGIKLNNFFIESLDDKEMVDII